MTDLRSAGELSTGELLDDRYRLHRAHRRGRHGARLPRGGRRAAAHRGGEGAARARRRARSVERALSETTVLASLNHHALVTLFDAHISRTRLSYLVMEYVEGITLRDRIARGPIDPEEMASITVDIAEGLHVAHTAGIVHRDIKPSNVLLWRSPLPGQGVAREARGLRHRLPAGLAAA